VIAHIYSSYGYDERLDVYIDDLDLLTPAMLPIWPASSAAVRWPLEVGLDDIGVDLLTRAANPHVIPPFPDAP
jgi:hypothetical protein